MEDEDPFFLHLLRVLAVVKGPPEVLVVEY